MQGKSARKWQEQNGAFSQNCRVVQYVFLPDSGIVGQTSFSGDFSYWTGSLDILHKNFNEYQ